MKKQIFLFASFLFLGTVPVWSDVGIEATVNPSLAFVGQPMTLTITVNGAASVVRTPRLPNFENFRSYSQGHSQEISNWNGVISTRNVFNYVLVPTVAGKHVLGQIEVEIGGRIYKTGVLEVQVLDKQTASSSSGTGRLGGARSPVVSPATRSLPPEYLAGRHIFVRTWVDKDDVYVNEAIYLTYTIYTRVSATFKGFEKEPGTTGFWVEEFPPQGTVRRQEKRISGYRYVVADVRTVALFPTEPGNFTIDPGTLNVEIEIQSADSFDRFFSRDLFGWRRFRRPRSVITQVVPRLLETDPIGISVKPLPQASKPADFKGAVGRYQIDASLDRTSVEEGQPVTYTLRLKGEGNLHTVEMPGAPDLDYFKSYDSSSSLNLKKVRLVVEGEKIAETVLIPRKAGNFKIPPVSFSYFDPARQQYRTIQTKALSLKVLESTDDAPAPLTIGPGVQPRRVSLVGEDIRFVKNAPGALVHKKEPWITSLFYWWLNLGILLTGFIIVGARLYFEKSGKDVGLLRFKRSGRLARQRFKQSRGYMKKGSEKNFYEALSQAFYGYFSDKLNLEPGEVGFDLVETKLSGKLSDEEYQNLKEIFKSLDFGRFGKAETTSEDMKSLYKSCDEFMVLCEAKRL